jgi:hypothetical protein
MADDKRREREFLSRMSLEQLNEFMDKHNLHSEYEEFFATLEEYHEAMRQGHIARLSRCITLKSRG